MSDDPVAVKIAANEIEAELACGLLRQEGIQCAHRYTNFGAGSSDVTGQGGAREVLVARDDAERARELLA